VVKFLPKKFAVLIATIILYVKPAEAQFARQLFGSDPSQTVEFLFTVEGRPVDPLSMTRILSETYAEFGFVIFMSDFRFVTFSLDLFCCKISVHEPLCRHALEAFAHKIGKTNCQYDSFLTRMANHNSSTSTYYGRDQHCIIGIPADITEANFERCGTVCMI